jgi:hypothetical protein
MARLNDKKLLAALSQFGYPLLEPEARPDPNELLAELVKSGDIRLLEGFPVVLANALSRDEPKVNLAKAEKRLSTARHRDLLWKLIWLSQSLFQLYGLNLKPVFPVPGFQVEGHDKLAKALAENRPLKLGPVTLDARRLKNTFLNYVANVRKEATVAAKAKLQEDFRREYYLSLLLSPKQKDLLQKKLRGEPMTKTEREYFSRVVKKKLRALADPDLHRLAQKALQ